MIYELLHRLLIPVLAALAAAFAFLLAPVMAYRDLHSQTLARELVQQHRQAVPTSGAALLASTDQLQACLLDSPELARVRAYPGFDATARADLRALEVACRHKITPSIPDAHDEPRVALAAPPGPARTQTL